MIEISERRKLKTFSLLQGCEMVDGNTFVRGQYQMKKGLTNIRVWLVVKMTTNQKTKKLVQESLVKQIQQTALYGEQKSLPKA